MKFGYQASNTITVTSLVKGNWFLLSEDNFFPTKEVGSLGLGRGGKWAGWVINGLVHKWVECLITHLSIYDPFIYKLIIYYPPNPFN